MLYGKASQKQTAVYNSSSRRASPQHWCTGAASEMQPIHLVCMQAGSPRQLHDAKRLRVLAARGSAGSSLTRALFPSVSRSTL